MTYASGTPGTATISRILIPLGAALSLLPWVSTGAALIAGALVGLVLGNPVAVASRKAAHLLLQLSVIGLGAGMDLRVVARVGAHGVVYTVLGITLCLALGALLARVLRVDGNTAALISFGTAICGGSAIAAVAPVLKAKDHQVAVALATVFLLNGVALFLFPFVGHAAALGQDQFGLWAALAIHDTSSVVGASMAYGGRALEVATSVKLARALWIVPVTVVVGYVVARRRDGQPEADSVPSSKPWFIVGFIAASALVSFVPTLRPAGLRVGALAKHVMAATLFLIGAGLTRATLRAVGVRPLVMGVLLWACVSAVSLAVILFH